ncbi:hypothetical protein A2690_01740 [Candidatus Roizmanbacteria bacterium RIFCSPHIGHO2_01_FULL_39_12b]|uniref:ZIP zinc transporter n=1 Tax=Candidatus Roizmanbacteria bacterium RIFCSPHIGHO2_01_FULL_39_12b TaxID=1802030 RepID=A0A1F7GB55_9BACT|nr:MAG: hypothetical protein A2690_01740 [Candidatus Roizmanbacteria bacterium RIFCSPHIGHO2_01_FULL_39_12b]OGK46143.1 MAG: hypothetical protein A3B46_02985 [Candidatus Roizmanbacteria bacterium RIFCSPLOWO2_01_FULL_39_19]
MLFNIIIASILISLTSFAGGILLIWRKLLTKKIIPLLISFAAGVILTVSFFDLLPEAAEQARALNPDTNIFIPTFLGIISFFFFERILLGYHHHGDTHRHNPIAILVLVGDGVHNFIDGVIIAAGFLLNPALGITTTIAIAAHEIPHEIADFTVLIHEGMKKSKALFYNFLSSLTALVGAIGGYFFLESIQNMLPAATAFSAGTLIYIACSDLIPDLHEDFEREKRWSQLIPFIVGIVVMYMAISITHGVE